jgi:hypothetical protein
MRNARARLRQSAREVAAVWWYAVSAWGRRLLRPAPAGPEQLAADSAER